MKRLHEVSFTKLDPLPCVTTYALITLPLKAPCVLPYIHYITMKLSKFNFTLPSKLIATHPSEHRGDARLMVVHKETGKIEHKTFNDLVDYLQEDDMVVLNDTKVLPAKLYGSKDQTVAEIEVFLLRELESTEHLWDTLVEPARKIRVGNKLSFGENDELVAEVLDNTTSRGRTLKFLFNGTTQELYDIVERFGRMPLPEQIKRPYEPIDQERLQTIFAKHIGAVVPPASGLHVTPHLLKRLELKGVHAAAVTLHISLNAVKNIEVEDLAKYKLGAELLNISEETVLAVNKALGAKKRICAIGSATATALENSVSVAGNLKTFNDWTSKLILPPHNFKICNALVTNFHLPESLPLVAVSAFLGYEMTKEMYQVAIKEKYKFFIYGDAMLII